MLSALKSKKSVYRYVEWTRKTTATVFRLNILRHASVEPSFGVDTVSGLRVLLAPAFLLLSNSLKLPWCSHLLKT
jgi:hypothetical protein